MLPILSLIIVIISRLIPFLVLSGPGPRPGAHRTTSRPRACRGITAESAVIAVRLVSSLLGHILAGIDPVAVDVLGSGEEVDGGLEALAAHLAVQLTDVQFFVQLDLDGLFVVAEQAGKGGGEWFALWLRTFFGVSKRSHWEKVSLTGDLRRWKRTFLGPWGLREDFLRLPWMKGLA